MRQALRLLLLFGPLLGTGLLTVWSAVDVPVQDEWSLVEDFAEVDAGTWSLDDLLRSHNGHRIAIPRLILVGLGQLTAWRADVPVVLSVLAAAWLLWTVGWRDRHEAPLSGMALAAIGVLVASPAQWENWFWGIQMHVFLVVVMVVEALRLLARGRLGPGCLAGAAGVSVAACLVSAAGLVAFPAGAVALTARAWVARSWRLFAGAVAWALGGAVLVWLYVQPRPGDAGLRAPDGFVSEHPLEAVRFLCAVVGHGVVAWGGAAFPPRDWGVAWVAGALGLLVASLLSAWHLRGGGRRPGGRAGGGLDGRDLAWGVALLAFAVLVGVQIALGRASFGPTAALASRYVTMLLPFWIGVVVLLDRSQLALPWRRAGLGLLVMATAVSGLSQLRSFPDRSRILEPARQALLTGEDPALLVRLHSEVFQVEAGVPTLRRLGLSVFRPGEPVPVALAVPLEPAGRRQLVRLTAPAAMRAGQRLEVAVELANTGVAGWSEDGDGNSKMVRLGARWFDATGAMVHEGPRRRLPEDLAAGARVPLKLMLEAPATPGRYRLEVGGVQEGVAWFESPATFEVEVAP